MLKRDQNGCPHLRLERCGRTSLWDAWMHRLGKYPWRCARCDARLYFTERRPSDHGGPIRSRQSAPMGPVSLDQPPAPTR